MLDVRRLALLRELHLRGTLAAVAEALHQSPSSVSQQLALLEKEVGVELLRKAGRRVRLTPQAEILVEHAAAVIAQLEQAESDLASSLHEATGSIRIAAFQSVVLALLPDALARLTAQHPHLRVTMVQREPETALRQTWAHDFDLVVAEQYPGHAAPWHPELDRLDLTTDALCLATPASGRPWGHVDSVAAASDAPWVMEPDGSASRHWAEQTCRQAGFEPDVRYETADLQAHARLVESGHAVALTPELLWRGRESSARRIDLQGMPRRTIFTAARLASAASPAVIACRKALAAAAANAEDPTER